MVFAGTDRTFDLAKKYQIKTAFGTDILFSPQLARRQGELLAKLVRWYTPAETLAMATGTNAELLALSGERNPYPGRLGVVEQGALADLLLVDGDPIADIKLIERSAEELPRHHEGREESSRTACNAGLTAPEWPGPTAEQPSGVVCGPTGAPVPALERYPNGPKTMGCGGLFDVAQRDATC